MLELGSMVTLLKVLIWKEVPVMVALSAMPFFALFIEPIAQLIRDDQGIKEIRVRGLEQKLSIQR